MTKVTEDQSEIISNPDDRENHSDGRKSDTTETLESDAKTKEEPTPAAVVSNSKKYDFANTSKTEARVIYMGHRNAQLERFITGGIDGNFLDTEQPWSDSVHVICEKYYYECPSDRQGHSDILDATLLFNTHQVETDYFLSEIQALSFHIGSSGRGYGRPYRCCLLAFDVTSRKSFESLPPIHQTFSLFQNHRQDDDSVSNFVVIGTFPSSETPREISTLEAESFASSLGCPYFEIQDNSSPEHLLSLQKTIIKFCHESIDSEKVRHKERNERALKLRHRKKKFNRCIIM